MKRRAMASSNPPANLFTDLPSESQFKSPKSDHPSCEFFSVHLRAYKKTSLIESPEDDDEGPINAFDRLLQNLTPFNTGRDWEKTLARRDYKWEVEILGRVEMKGVDIEGDENEGPLNAIYRLF